VQMIDFFSALLEREAGMTRRALERVPEGRNDWKPHPKSMPLGYLAALVARLPSWVGMVIELDEYEMQSQGSRYQPVVVPATRELLRDFEAGVVHARQAFDRTTDAHLLTNWRLLVGGRPVVDLPRHIVLIDSVMSHLSHHRGQLTVYLRLNDVPVPALFGPSADETGF
jgi:uncharacterized damage-inducible protein DinB